MNTVPNVKPLDRTNTYINSLSVALEAMGEDVSYVETMGFSGAAFRLHVYSPGWCPSAPDATCGFNCGAAGAKAYGHTLRYVDIAQKDPSPVAAAKREIVASIDAGRPLLAIDLVEVPDWGVVVGYEKNGDVLICRDWHGDRLNYQPARKTPWFLNAIDERGVVPPRRENALKSLDIAVELADTLNYGKYMSGFEAYRVWVADLRDEAAFESASPDGFKQLRHSNAWYYESLVDARSCASRYLDAIAGEFDGDANVYLKNAAAIYAEIEKVLREGRSNAPWTWQPGEWTAEMRRAEAETLSQAMRLERNAVGWLDIARKTIRGEAPVGLRYGFRVDPMMFVANSRTLQGALVRKHVFGTPVDGDDALLEAEVTRLLAAQRPDGTFGDSAKETGGNLVRLLSILGCDPSRPEIARALDAMMSQRKDGEKQEDWADDDKLLAHSEVRALALANRTDVPELADSLNWYAGHPEFWIGHGVGCPWTPICFLSALWDGRRLADVGPAISTGLRWVRDAVNDAGCLSYKDPWGFVNSAGHAHHPIGRDIIERQLPMILRGQGSDGGWGDRDDRTLVVFRALSEYGFLDVLRARPALPPDWNVTHSVPSPAKDSRYLAWDGKHLWTTSEATREAIAFSPEDGAVARKVAIPFGRIAGLECADGKLVFVRNGPEGEQALVTVTPDSLDEAETIPLRNMVGPVSVARVRGKYWVGDAWIFGTNVVDPARPERQHRISLAAPCPTDLTSTGDAVWQVDYFAPLLVKSDLIGELLDWGEKPFGGNVAGIAWNSWQLWAIDGANNRVCVIEKAKR